MIKTLTLNTIFNRRQKRGCWGQWFGISKKRKGINMERERQMFGKQVFAGPCKANGTQRGILTNRLWQVPPCLHTQFILQFSVGMAPFMEQDLIHILLGSFRESQSLLGLDHFSSDYLHNKEIFFCLYYLIEISRIDSQYFSLLLNITVFFKMLSYNI